MPPELYPGAIYKPLGIETQPRIQGPTAIILHTMGGYLNGTDTTFRSGGYTGTESHFGVGGHWDGEALDGAVWQWQDLRYTADAQYEGNSYGVSIETSDGRTSEPWDVLQLKAITTLIAWLCKTYKIPPKLMLTPSDLGIGYHSLFPVEWNRDGHNCPGITRVNQLVSTVIPAVAGLLEGEDVPGYPFFLITDGKATYKCDGVHICHVHDIAALAVYESLVPTVTVDTDELKTYQVVGTR